MMAPLKIPRRGRDGDSLGRSRFELDHDGESNGYAESANGFAVAATVTAVLAAALSLAGCAVGPHYVPPDTPPAEFDGGAGGLLVEKPFEAAWWAQFGDPLLDELIERALVGDLDIRIAAARIDESRALLHSSRRAQWPSSQYQAVYDESKAQQPLFTDERVELATYRSGLQTAWELDLFGRLRRGAEAAVAEAQAAEATLRDVQVLVAAEVASTYVDLREAQKRLRVAEANLENQRETLRLTQVRYELGRSGELDVASARATLAATEARLPSLVTAENIAKHRLAVLLGARPGRLDLDLAYRDMPLHLTTLAVGSADALLTRRADVRAAERRLAAATARVGVEKADLFPRVSLSGFLGFVTGDSSQLGDSSSRAWSATPVISWSAFDLSGARADVHAAEARSAIALAEYEQTVLGVLEETQNAFVSYAQQRRRLESVIEQAAASRRAAELARIQSREGALDFLRLLEADRALLDAEDAVAVAEAQLNRAVVAVYKAIGGGWEGT